MWMMTPAGANPASRDKSVAALANVWLSSTPLDVVSAGWMKPGVRSSDGDVDGSTIARMAFDRSLVDCPVVEPSSAKLYDNV
jgi:hypothetical protein